MLDAREMARLVREADGDREITSSTIHYYTQLGILPPAVGRGKGAFAPEHLARLRLARKLRREGLSLAEIREEMERLPRRDLVQEIADSEALLALSAPAAAADAMVARARSRAGADAISTPSTPTGTRTGSRTLRFRGGFALHVPASVPDEFVSRIYAGVEKVLDREIPRAARGKRGSL
jgi:DNA-binding transcriptional MerR regulator